MPLNKSQLKLLNLLENDSKNINKLLYYPGPYWGYKAKKILFWLKKKGLDNFRGLNSGVGTSYTDNYVEDIRFELGTKGRIVSSLFSLPFLNKIFNKQLDNNHRHIVGSIKYQGQLLQNSEKVKFLLSKYKIENSTSFGCIRKVNIQNKEYAIRYISLLERIDYLTSFFNLNKINSLIEIGGGFGSNIHLLIQNFTNIKKIIYVDIFPNIFVGTEYLRNLFGNSVKDYSTLNHLDEIKFEDNNDLEIICIPNWLLEKVTSKVDKLHNAASFQEMTIEQVENYKLLVSKILNKNLISLIVYKSHDSPKHKTLNSDTLKKIFTNCLVEKKFLETHENKNLIYLLSL